MCVNGTIAHTNTHTHTPNTHIHKHTQTHTHKQTNTHTHTHTHKLTNIHTKRDNHTYTFIQTNSYICNIKKEKTVNSNYSGKTLLFQRKIPINHVLNAICRLRKQANNKYHIEPCCLICDTDPCLAFK